MSGPPQSTSHYGADEPYTYSSRRYRVPPAVAENHQGGSNFRFSTNDFDCAGRGALTSEGPHRIDHAHGYGSNFYRSEHRHSSCPRSRCLSVGLVRSTCCATPAQTTLGEVRDRGLDCRIFGRLPSISSVQIDGAKIMVPMIAFAFSPSTRQDERLRCLQAIYGYKHVAPL